MKTYLAIKVLFLSLLLVLTIPQNGYGQKKKKVANITVKSTVVNQEGEPIAGATITSNEGAFVTRTSSDGTFVIKAKRNSIVLIESEGYENKGLISDDINKVSEVSLFRARLLEGQKDVIHLANSVELTKRHSANSVSVIKSSNLKSYPDMLLSNTLQGQASGLLVQSSLGGLGKNSSTLTIRGNGTNGNTDPLIIVDGVERSMDYIQEEEIASMYVLKDASAKVLYGARAANGVIVVNTKRGDSYKRNISISADYGVGVPLRMPDYLNAYDYVKLYDEARVNDGLSPIYARDYDGYLNSEGPNDLRYPNVDYYDYFLKNTSNYGKANAEFSGGNERTQYMVYAGYNGTKGMQKVGKNFDRSAFNLRGNVNVQISKMVSAYASISFQILSLKRGSMGSDAMFDALSSHRPNEYPLILPTEYFPLSSKGIPALGASTSVADNLYGSLMYGGKVSEQEVNGTMDFGLNLNLDKLLPGLKANGRVSLDSYFIGNEVLNNSAATYSRKWLFNDNGEEYVVFEKEKKENINDNLNLTNTSTRRAMNWEANLSYDKKIGLGQLNAMLGYNYMQIEQKGTNQNIQNANYLLNANYVYNDKYIANGTLSYTGSNRFKEHDRYFLAGALALGWIVSNESFMKNSPFDFLKLKASAGILGYDANTPYFLYANRYYNGGSVAFGEENKTSAGSTNWTIVGNDKLKWEKSQEINVGIEGMVLNKRLSFEVNYFNELRKDIILKMTSAYSSVYGGYISYENVGKISNQGVEVELRWNDRCGQFQYEVGANATWTKNKVKNDNVLNQPYDYMNKIGKPSDVILGYVSQGLFGKEVELDGHPVQLFGNYSNGDIAYADLNGDQIIDEKDRKVIGNTFPRTSLGVDLNLKYKGWGLYILGTAQLGMDKVLNNRYYWNYGEGKYSVKALDRYHPEYNPNGTMPRLTTSAGENNYRDSDFWIEDASFFRLKNVELSYTFTNIPAIQSLKLYARGTNLLTVSKIKDLDPEVLGAGLTNYPVMMNIVGGFSLTF